MAQDGERPKPTNLFIANEVYPDASAVFTAVYKGVEEIKDDCVVVLDTNTLLLPYTVSSASLDQIKSTYVKLAKEGRLVVPGQVAREFARNRPTKIAEIRKQVLDASSRLNDKVIERYPLLESLAEYRALVECGNRLKESVTACRKAVDELAKRIQSWNWDDPVSGVYRDIFSTLVVLDSPPDKEAVPKELDRRVIHKLPPGYKDQAKDDGGIGDLLIWLTIIAIGKTHKKSLIFVSADEKADWWHRSNDQPLFPRFELVDEYRRESEGGSFHICKLSDLLSLYGVEEAVVAEVRDEEQVRPASATRQETGAWSTKTDASLAVINWLNALPDTTLGQSVTSDFDYVLVRGDGTLSGVKLKYIIDGRLEGLSDFLKHQNSRTRFSSLHPMECHVVLVFLGGVDSSTLRRQLETLSQNNPLLTITVGIMTEHGAFNHVFTLDAAAESNEMPFG